MRITPLLSWDLVHTGACHWTDARECVPCDTPSGIELAVEPASKTGPIMPFDQPWEQGSPGWAQVLADKGVYRLWYTLTRRNAAQDQLLCYAESDDGFAWRKPALGLVEVDGSTANNVVFSGPGANHSCVLKDPSAPPAARYRCMYFKSWWEGAPGEELDNDEGHRRLNAKNAAEKGEEVLPVSLKGALMGLNSPDGLKWTPIDQPILDEWHDTHNICVYDQARGKYLGYFRGSYAGRRAVSYAETEDFANWPATELLAHALVDDAPDASLYSNCYTRYPGNPGIHLMFPGIYHLATDHVDGELAVSLDGKRWSRHAGQPSVLKGKPGEPDEGFNYPEPELLRFSREGRFRLLCRSGTHYHNEWYNEKLRHSDKPDFLQWAEWPEDRLAGVHAKNEGAFALQMQPCGDRLLANFRTAPDGWVRFELVDRLPWPPIPWDGLEGYRFADMPPLTGDETHAPVAWQGRADLSELQGKNVALRVRLFKATLYSVTMYGVDEPMLKEDPRYPV